MQRVLAASGLAAGGAAVFFVAYFNPSKVNFFPVCPLYSLTGIACPGCGLTRGFHALFHGDLLTAIDYNLLAPVFFLFFAYLGISMLLVVLRGRGLPLNIYRPKLLFGILTGMLVFAVVRNLPFYPFNFLAP